MLVHPIEKVDALRTRLASKVNNGTQAMGYATISIAPNAVRCLAAIGLGFGRSTLCSRVFYASDKKRWPSLRLKYVVGLNI